MRRASTKDFNRVQTTKPKTRDAADSKQKSSKSSSSKKSRSKATEESANAIKEILKLHYMRIRNDERTVRFLYGSTQGMRQLEKSTFTPA